jgi:hypothetical protein
MWRERGMCTEATRRSALVLAVAVAVLFAASVAVGIGVILAPPDPYYVTR